MSRVFEVDAAGPTIAREADVLDIIGDAAWGHAAEWVALPVQRLDPSFFELRSGLLGAVLQKFVNYHLKVAIVGDVSGFVASSSALRDFVYESNRGRQVWFVTDRAELKQRLTGSR